MGFINLIHDALEPSTRLESLKADHHTPMPVYCQTPDSVMSPAESISPYG